VATGSKCVEDIPAGARVFFDPIGAEEVTVDGTKLLVMLEENIKATEYNVDDYKTDSHPHTGMKLVEERTGA